jgi:hypothetical protein
MAADLRELRRQVGEVAARCQLAHEDALAELEPGADDLVEWHLRRARHKAAEAFRALSDAIAADEAELRPMGQVRR